MEWGTDEKQRLLEKRRNRGDPVPALDRQPELSETALPIYDAWNELGQHRQSGFSINPITLESIIAWMNENDIEGDDRRWYYELIMRMEEHFVKKHRK